MTPFFADESVTLYVGDALDVLASLPDDSVDSVVTDPPYGLAFMGKAWDTLSPSQFQAWCEKWSAECLRVLKPGGHMLAFGGTRTYHRLACAVEDAGFEIRDSITWLYGSGFPKSLDVGKAIDKAAGAQRTMRVNERWAEKYPNGPGGNLSGDGRSEHYNQAKRIVGNPLMTSDPVSDEAQRWHGWGTALKPASEPIVVARKPLAGTVAGNVQVWGTGALNIDATRIAHGADVDMTARQRQSAASDIYVGGAKPGDEVAMYKPGGRWPANVVLTHHHPDCNGQCTPGCPVAELDQQSGNVVGARSNGKLAGSGFHRNFGAQAQVASYADQGGASRFFPTFRYQAKAPSRQRPKLDDGTSHPTVKPLDLMRWLVRLVTPPNGTVLDPFAGSGTTLEAATLEGFRSIGIERDPQYLQLCEQRLSKHTQPDLFAS